MKTKKWFVILQQEEIERCKTAMQTIVFMAIKSYTGNGKNKVALSLRDISERAKCSHEYVRKVSTQLTELGLIKIVGDEKRRGGPVNIYKVSTPLTVNKKSVNTVDSKSKKVSTQLTDNPESVNWVGESVNSSGTKNRQSNKVSKDSKKTSKNSLTPCSEEELCQIAYNRNIDVESVKRKHQIILNKIEAGEFKNNTVYYTLDSWLLGDIEKGILQEMDETQKMMFVGMYRQYLNLNE